MKKIMAIMLAAILIISFAGCRNVENKSTETSKDADESNKELIKKTIIRLYDQVELFYEAKGDYNLFFSNSHDFITQKKSGENKFQKYISDLDKYFDSDLLTNLINKGQIPSDEYAKAGYNKAEVTINSIDKEDSQYVVKYSVKYTGVNEGTVDYEVKVEVENGKIKKLDAPKGIGIPNLKTVKKMSQAL